MAEPTPDTRPVDETAPTDTNQAAPNPEEEIIERREEEESEEKEEMEEMEEEEDVKSKRVTLADLSAKGTALYAHKKYEEATDIFSTASDLQAEINGETAPENAEILFHYGRSLFKVGQSKSDVLGGPAAAEKRTAVKASGSGSSSNNNKAASGAAAKPAEAGAEKVTPEGVATVAGQSEAGKDNKGNGKSDVPEAKKALFQFTGDENFDESDEDEYPEEEEQEDDDDDLATAFEILDLARVCYLKQLDKLRLEDEKEEDTAKGKEVAKEDTSAVRHIKERLAETHDALAEISLENERYPNAIEDGRVSLDYKMELYPEESEIIAEAHYKLSLALEFASVTISGEDGQNSKREEMDRGLRDEAIKEMELAIKSFRLKMQATEVEVASSASPEDNELSRKALVEMKEVIGDMEQRLVDLRKDPISAKDLVGGDEANPLGGLFGAALGESAAEIEARVEEAKKTAVDLTSLVRKKKAKDTEADENTAARTQQPAATTNGKRKAENAADEAESPKRAKMDEDRPAAEEAQT